MVYVGKLIHETAYPQRREKYKEIQIYETENELIIRGQLNETAKLVLPNLSQLIKMTDEKNNSEIKKIEIYRNSASVIIENKPGNANIFDL